LKKYPINFNLDSKMIEIYNGYYQEDIEENNKNEKDIKKNNNANNITVYLYIEFDERIINESLNFNFNSNVYVKDMIKVIIENYNHYFEEQKINIKLKSEGLGYELVNYESSENIKHKKPFSKNQKLKELNTKIFNLKYYPQDIMINFERKKLFGCLFC
jgi:hypothetical protein